jgi:phosphoglycerate dehydrogenase-like enzyme
MADAPHPSFRIFADLPLTASAQRLLEEGAAAHELIVSSSPSSSMLASARTDPRLESAQILFGQPDPAAIARAPHVKWIQISSSGITRYDNPEFRAQMAARQIPVCNSAHVFAESCALHVLSFMLAHARQLPTALKSRHPHGESDWHTLRGSCMPLADQTVLILGFGAIGERLAEMLAPHKMRVLAHRRRARGDEKVPVVPPEGLADALAEADHIVNILPDSRQTRNFFDGPRFLRCKPGAIFYNIGRGGTVDQDALHAALNSGRISTAWLDVTEPEPLPAGHLLLSHPHCFITPHIAGGHTDEVGHIVRHFLENLDRFITGRPLHDRVM